MCGVLPGFSFVAKDAFRSLEKLVMTDVTFLRSFTIPKTMKTLEVLGMKGQYDLDVLRDAIVRSGGKDCHIEKLCLEWKLLDVEPLYACVRDITSATTMSSECGTSAGGETRPFDTISTISLIHPNFTSSESLSQCLSHLLTSLPSLETFEWILSSGVSYPSLSTPMNPSSNPFDPTSLDGSALIPTSATKCEAELSKDYREVELRDILLGRAFEISCEIDALVLRYMSERQRNVFGGEGKFLSDAFSRLDTLKLCFKDNEESVELMRNVACQEWTQVGNTLQPATTSSY